MNLGNALVKIYNRIGAIEKKIIKLEANVAIPGIETGRFRMNFPSQEKKGDSTIKSSSREKSTIADDKSALIAEIQEAQKRKIEVNPEKRKILSEKRAVRALAVTVRIGRA